MRNPLRRRLYPLSQAMRRRLRQADPRPRVLPEFLIIGVQKGATTFLYQALSRHPEILRGLRKQIHYFDLNYDKGENWYRAHFATRAACEHGGVRRLSFEATPNYIFDPRVPLRMAALLPTARLIVCLRHPISRAFSHYQMLVRRGRETEDFPTALALEGKRLAGEEDRMLREPAYYSYSRHHFGYLARSLYGRQVALWLEHFPREQIKFITLEDLREAPDETFSGLFSFLGIEDRDLGRLEVPNAGGYRQTIAAETRVWMENYFRDDIARLASLVGPNVTRRW